MRAEITERGVFDGTGKEIEVGETITFKGDDLPAALRNKARLIGGKPKGKMVVNPAKGDARADLDEQASELVIHGIADMGDDALKAAIDAKLAE